MGVYHLELRRLRLKIEEFFLLLFIYFESIIRVFTR